MSLTRRIAADFRIILAARVFRMLTQGVLVLLLTRVFLTPSEYGLLFFAISILGVAVIFANLGLGKSAGRYVTSYRESEPGQVPHILRTALTYNIYTIALIGTALLVFSEHIAAYLSEPALAPLLLLGIAYVAGESLMTFTSTAFQGFNSLRWSAAVSIVSNITQILLVVAFLVVGFGTIGALAGYAASYAIAGGLGLIVVYRLTDQFSTADTPEPGLRRRILEYSIPLTATRCANVLDRRIDVVIVGALMNPVAVGYYVLGKQISSFLMSPATALGFTVAPTYGEQKANGNDKEAGRMYETTLTYTLLLYLPAAVGIVIVAEPTVRYVFGADYLGAVPVIQLLSAFVVLQAVTNISNDALDYLGRARERALVKGGTSAVNLGLNLALIPIFGVVGAAAATVVTYSAYTLINVYLVYAEFPLRIDRLSRTIATITGISLVMAIVVSAVQPHVTSVLWLGGVVVLGGIVWGVLAIGSGLLDVDQIRSTFA